MSHDRACFKCWEEKWDWKYCQRKDCPKRREAPPATTSGAPQGDAALARVKPTDELLRRMRRKGRR